MKTSSRAATMSSLLVLALFAELSRGGAQSASATMQIPVEGKIDSSTGQLLILAQFNDTRLWCGLDSGFSALIAIDETHAQRAGLRKAPGIPTPDGRPPSPGDSSSTAMLNVGGVSFGEQSVILRRLPAEAPEMECVMGIGVLKRFAVELDYALARVRLHDRTAYRQPDGAQRIPLIFRTNPNVPFVQIDLTFMDGTRQQAQVLADTGTSYFTAIFLPPFLQAIRPRIPKTALPAIKNDSMRPTLKLEAARLPGISVGPFTVREPVVALVEAGVGGGNDDGTLGVGFFERFSVTFDFAGRAMYLLPNKRISERQPFDASGIVFRKNATSYEVDFVLPDSPGSRVDVREGDRLLQLDGRPVDRLTLLELRDLMSHPGETRELRLARGNQILNVSLPLRERL